MLVNCKPKCPGKRGSTQAVIDKETDTVVCEFCREELNVSSFAKTMMKQNHEYLKKQPKAFQFKCETCHLDVQTELKGNKLYGKGCQKECQFKVSEYFLQAMKTLGNSAHVDTDAETDE